MPALSSVPVRRPVVSSSSRPGGILPAIANCAVRASFPVTGNLAEYRRETVPAGSPLPLAKSMSGRMLNDHGTDTFAPVESVTVIVEANLPDDVAAPVTAPVAASSVTPGGSAPADVNVYGALPPTAFTPVVRALLTVVFAVHPLVGGFLPTSDCTSSGASTKSERPRVSLVPLPFAWTLKLNVPLWVGVPEMTPFAARVRPAGSAPPARVHEFTVSPEACSAGAVYGWLKFASGRLGVVTVSFGCAPLTLIVYRWSEAGFVLPHA